MAASRSKSTNNPVLPEGLRNFVRKKCFEIIGLGVLGGVLLVALSLATWSIHDPSFNHATDARPTNLLGYPGAAISDLLMQLFGLGAVGLIAPVAAWGAKLMAQSPINRPFKRLAVWLIGGLLTAGCLATFGLPAGWPLPSGLGGAVGDYTLAPFAGFFSVFFDPLLTRILSGLVIGFFAIIAIVYASALTMEEIILPARIFGEESAELAMHALGAAAHSGMRVKSMASRFVRSRVAGAAESIVRRPPEPTLEDEPEEERNPNYGFAGDKARWTIRDLTDALSRQFRESEAEAPVERIEPRLEGEVMPEAPAEDYPFDDEPEVVAEPAPRVQPSKTSLKPGKRVKAEAQPSLALDEDFEYELPPLGLLAAPKKTGSRKTMSDTALEQNARILEGVLEDFGVRGEIINVRPGPVVTLYELEPAPGIKSSRVIGLADDIARSMSAISARVAVVPGRNAIGIELPNVEREMVFLRELLASEDYEKTGFDLSLALGKTIGGEPVISDLARMPHLLIAGTTGSGKSVGINTMILSLLYRLSPDKCKLIMIDPKMLELSVYDGIPHLLAPVVTDPKKAVVALKWTVKEMEDRYRKMSKVGVRNIDGFNTRVAQARAKGEVIVRTVQTGFDKETGQPVYEHEEMDLEPMPYIVVIVDEMADLMMVAGKDIEGAVQRLAQMARAAGIHMITATQRPSVDVITGTIKANFPTRISFQVTSKVDSRTILGEQGAEQLLGQGDMLYMAGGGRISRVHGPFVSDQEVEKVVKFLKKQGVPQYLEAVTEEPEDGGYELPGMASEGGSEADELYDKAVAIVARDKKASTSYIQRRLSIGYNRAATIIERMEEEGVISPANHAGKREVLIGEPGEGVNA